MADIVTSTSNRSWRALRLPNRREVLVGLIAAVGIAATGRSSDLPLDQTIDPKLRWGAINDRRTDQGINRTQRTGPHTENWGRFDWVHEYHRYEMTRWAPVSYDFVLPANAASLTVTTMKLFELNKQSFETDVAWKEVGLLFGGKAIQEKGERSYPLAPATQLAADRDAKTHWKTCLRKQVFTSIKTAQRIAKDRDLNPSKIEIDVIGGQLVRATLALEGREVDIMPELTKNSVVKATLAKSAESWTAKLSF